MHFLLEKNIGGISLGYCTTPIWKRVKGMWSLFLQLFQVSSAHSQSCGQGTLFKTHHKALPAWKL